MKTLTQYTQLLNNKFTKKNVIAPVESSSTASQAYTEGKKFFYNNILYEATDDIAEGGLIVPDTNCTPADNIIDQIENKTVVTDPVPTQGSTNPVQSGGVYNSLDPVYNVLGAKNILPNNAVSQTIDGVTFTVNSDGSVTANGTATADVYFSIPYHNFKAGSYILNGCPNGGGLSGPHVLFIQRKIAPYVVGQDIGNGVTFTLIQDESLQVRCKIWSGQTVSNLTFYPMIRPASITDDTYVPYSMTNQEMTPYVQAISNPNLLDNPWFTVNQRGFTSGNTNGYTVDRWRLNVTCTVTVNSDNSITLSKAVGEAPQFVQFVDPTLSEKLDGKTVTLSALIGNTIYKGTFVYENEDNFIYQIPINNEWVLDYRCLNNSATGHIVRFLTSGTTLASDITIKAVKLELGSVSTLAMDTAPNYATELLKCQRYFVRFKSGSTYSAYSEMGFVVSTTEVRVPLNLPTNMRTSPTVNTSGAFRIFNATDYSTMSSTITSVTGITFLGSKITLKCVGSGFVTSKMVALAADNDANTYIDFSADL